jgi:hypothetical protein
MSSIRIVSLRAWLPVLLVLVLAGCGERNPQSVFSADDGGTHLSGWLPAGHMAAATANINVCVECHGADFSGGISKVACTQCHLGNAQKRHPIAWGDIAYVSHASYVNLNGTTACSNIYCHGTALNGVAASGPSCSSCHIGGNLSVHPSPLATWVPPGIPGITVPPAGAHGAYVKQFSSTAACQNAACHGKDLKGVNQSGLSCQSCHTATLFSQYMK